ncbi:hypothetical protein HG530_006341 [Fusarium avenaceum]|nr:hypothetical protein HG530_006341 [Fusarium avenaceum]
MYYSSAAASTSGHRVFVHLEPVFNKCQDDTADPRNFAHRRHFHGVVLARVDLVADTFLHAIDSSGLGGCVTLNMLADPDVPVHAEKNINFAAGISCVHRPDLSLGSNNTAATTGSSYGDKDAVAQLAVLQTTGVQTRRAVLMQLLNLCNNEVSLGEEAADLQFIGLAEKQRRQLATAWPGLRRCGRRRGHQSPGCNEREEAARKAACSSL